MTDDKKALANKLCQYEYGINKNNKNNKNNRVVAHRINALCGA